MILETVILADYNLSRPPDGACYLDFLDVWFTQARLRGDAEAMGRYAREMGHWALRMHPDLAPLPYNVELGYN